MRPATSETPSSRQWRVTAWALLAAQMTALLAPVAAPAIAASATGADLRGGASHTGGDAAPMARSLMAGEAGNAGEQWLSQFGTARIQLNLDDSFTLKDSAADILVPLYDTPKSTLFTQWGVRNKDARNTANLGIGVRTQQDNWLYGVNTFYDYDMTGKHRRLGVGTEAWTDYLKLSANGYLGLSDWRQSRDFADRQERPANGFDVRAEAWLPSYPQLGGKLMYERYLGDDVALFGKGNRQQDPYALTAGLNYTPIPLLTLAAEHRAGKGSAGDSAINLQLNYRLGESFRSHIDPSNIAASRQLANSRYDLVERNNHIVLDYQKQESIRLTLPSALAGAGGETLTLTAEISGQNALDRVAWDTAALTAGGAVVSQPSPQSLAITLPAYRDGTGDNQYSVNAVAYDRRGNVSNRASSVIRVIAAEKETEPETEPETETGEAVAELSGLDVVSNHALADGKAVNQVRAEVRDGNGKPVADAEVSFSADNGAIVLDAMVKTDEQGRAQTRLTHTIPGVVIVTARSGQSSQQVEIEFMAMPVPQVNATIATLTSGEKIANNQDDHRLRVAVRDEDNNILPDYEVSFTSTEGVWLSQSSGKTGPDGSLVLTVASTLAGDFTVRAKGAGFEQESDRLTFIAGPVSQSASSLKNITNGTYANDGSIPHRAEVLLADAFGNPVEGQAVSFSFRDNNDSAELWPSGDRTGPDGKITLSIKSYKTQTLYVVADAGPFTLTSNAMSFAKMIES